MGSSLVGSTLGLGAKTLIVYAAVSNPALTATVVCAGLGFIAAAGLVAGYNAAGLARLRDDIHGGEMTRSLQNLNEGKVYDLLYCALELAPGALPVGKIIIVSLIVQSMAGEASNDPVQDLLERMTPLVADSVGSIVCSIAREAVSAVLKGVGPESAIVDGKGQPLEHHEQARLQTFSTGTQCTLDAMLTIAVYMRAPEKAYAQLAPFKGATDIMVYTGLRTGFGMIQELSKGLTAYVSGNKLQVKPAGQLKRLQENLLNPSKNRTWENMALNTSTRITTTALVAEPLMVGDLGPSGAVKFLSAVLVGSGEARGRYTDEGIEALKQWRQFCDEWRALMRDDSKDEQV